MSNQATTGTFVGPTTVWHVGWFHLGVALVTENLRWAAVGMLHETTSPRQAANIQQAVLFVEGTALDATLELFGIDMRGDGIRDAFHTWVQHRTTPYYP